MKSGSFSSACLIAHVFQDSGILAGAVFPESEDSRINEPA